MRSSGERRSLEPSKIREVLSTAIELKIRASNISSTKKSESLPKAEDEKKMKIEI